MINVLFVCLGNICRSPMAEAVFAERVEKAGLSDKISVDSAGTGGWHSGETAHPGTLKILHKYDIPYDGRARQLQFADFSRFDYVLAMDASNLSDIKRLNNAEADGNPTITTFLHYANEAGTVNEREVPDPYYDGSFDRVYRLISNGADALLAHIRAENSV